MGEAEAARQSQSASHARYHGSLLPFLSRATLAMTDTTATNFGYFP
jgi:hypothetical protein